MLENGTLLRNKYLILQILGKRGMSGFTYLAESTADSTLYAIKEFDPLNPEDYEELKGRFSLEADYLFRLENFNGQIPKFYESFTEKDSTHAERLYIVQEYIEGLTLSQYMEAQGRKLDESEVKEFLSRLLPVVEHIHQKGFIHRDIKPDNIILRSSDRMPVLIDFGAVKEYEFTLIRKGAAQTIIIGTKGYYDEDQATGKPTAASDLYALGAVAVYLLTNTFPSVMTKKDGKLQWSAYVLGLSQDFIQFIDKAIEPRATYPGQRFVSAQAMLEALTQTVSEEQLEEELTRLLTRQSASKTTENFIKCLGCKYYLNFKETNCTNCGAYNINCLDEDELELFNNSPEEYLKNTYNNHQNRTKALSRITEAEYFLINNPPGNFIKKHTKFASRLPDYLTFTNSYEIESIKSKLPYKIILGEFIKKNNEFVQGCVVAALVVISLLLGIGIPVLIADSEKNWLIACLSPFTAIFAVVLVVWLVPFVKKEFNLILEYLLWDKTNFSVKLRHLYEELNKKKIRLQEELLNTTKSRKKQVEEKVKLESNKYQTSDFYLEGTEKTINKQIEEISASKTRFSRGAEMLDSVIKDTPSDISTETQKREKERTAVAIKSLSEQDLKYKAKLQEIELLRLNNIIQAETPRHNVLQKKRLETKTRIGQMAKLSDKLFNELKSSNVSISGSEQLWLKRISLIREALMKLNISLASHIADLDYKGYDNEEIDFPGDIVSGLDFLTVYLTNEDFEKEYKLLQIKYGNK